MMVFDFFFFFLSVWDRLVREWQLDNAPGVQLYTHPAERENLYITTTPVGQFPRAIPGLYYSI